jgi:hypothetical protein
MELKHQVCSLEYAKKLEKLSVKQESTFVWWYTETMTTDVKYFPDQDWETLEWCLKPRTSAMIDSGRDLAAFTVAELGEMLPAVIQEWKLECQKRPTGGWIVSYYCDAKRFELKSVLACADADSEADARAKMLVSLLENKLILSDTVTRPDNHGSLEH